MITVTTSAARDTSKFRVRALYVMGGAAVATLAWAIQVPLLGIHLSARFGAMHPQTISGGQVAGSALAAGLLGWLLLTILERRTPRARGIWTATALVVLAASLVLPLTAATTASAAFALTGLHLAVGGVVIPGMAGSARRP
jgi:predicted permease